MYRPIGSVVLTRKSVSSLTQPIAGVYEARRMYANLNVVAVNRMHYGRLDRILLRATHN